MPPVGILLDHLHGTTVFGGEDIDGVGMALAPRRGAARETGRRSPLRRRRVRAEEPGLGLLDRLEIAGGAFGRGAADLRARE
jgi:hypothetical protein